MLYTTANFLCAALQLSEKLAALLTLTVAGQHVYIASKAADKMTMRV
jgi:hypothetical protein